MERWMERIKQILEEAPTRATPFSSLLEALARAGVAVGGREEWILRWLAEHPESFKVIPDRLGPWVRWPGMGGGMPPPFPSRGRADPWIMTCSLGSSSCGEEPDVVGRIRESLQAWGQAIDEGSQAAVARWIGANKEAEKAFGMVVTPAHQSGRRPRSTSRLLRPPQRM